MDIEETKIKPILFLNFYLYLRPNIIDINMCCILCFLNEETHKKMRSWAQVSKDRHEDCLNVYKNQFIEIYKNLQPIQNCEIHKNEDENLISYFNSVHQSLPNEKDINQLFKTIINIYIDWISNKQIRSHKSMRKLLNGIPISNFADKELALKLFYRCRKGEIAYTKEDLYHIPFNKRYLIGNQRYSICGIPVLYLGNSIIDTVVETRVDFDEIEKYQFSSFLLKPNKSLKLFKFINLFPSYISIIRSLVQDGVTVTLTKSKPYANDWINIFKIFILSSCCSFCRRDKEDSNLLFPEEYVLPQLITQVVFSLNYDGIIYESTQMDTVEIFSKQYKINYKLNLALYTRYSKKELYDYDLINKFFISTPVKIGDTKDISEKDVKNQEKKCLEKASSYQNLNFHEIASYSVSKSLEFDDLKMKEKGTSKAISYYKTSLGKFQKYLEYCAYNNFLFDK